MQKVQLSEIVSPAAFLRRKLRAKESTHSRKSLGLYFRVKRNCTLSIMMMAERLGLQRNTVARMERGEIGIFASGFSMGLSRLLTLVVLTCASAHRVIL